MTAGGLLRVDKAKMKTEANLDGKYLLRCSDPTLSAEDIAVGYKQLLEVEHGWRDMKSVLDLRPVYHRLEERIRAAHRCWPGRWRTCPSAARRPEPGPGAAPATITARLLTSAIPVVIGAVSAYGVWRFGPGEYRIIGVALLVTFVTYGAEDWWTPKTTRTARLLRILIESVTTVCLVIVGYAVGAMVDHPENHLD